jgi:probable HAF family extracellular repeat protein
MQHETSQTNTRQEGRPRRERKKLALLLFLCTLTYALGQERLPPALEKYRSSHKAAQCQYTVQPVEAPEDDGAAALYLQANALDASGVVAGVYWATGESSRQVRAFVWREGRMVDLGTLGGARSLALDINRQGQLVGQAEDTDGNFHAFLYQKGMMTDLGTLAGTRGLSAATALNNQGQVVGFTTTPNSMHKAFLWQDGAMQALELLPGYPDSEARAINSRSQIVGCALRRTADRREMQGHAVLWEQGRPVRDLGTLGGENSAAYAINDAGQVVGIAEQTNRRGAAVVWQQGKLKELGGLEGFQISAALDINNRGDIVGMSANSCADSRACLWRNGQLYDLNTCLPEGSDWVLRRASTINERGQIAGTGMYKGVARSFLLTPVK